MPYFSVEMAWRLSGRGGVTQVHPVNQTASTGKKWKKRSYPSTIRRNVYLQSLLNNEDIKCRISPGGRGLSEALGRFKKVRPARPQPFLGAERTGYT